MVKPEKHGFIVFGSSICTCIHVGNGHQLVHVYATPALTSVQINAVRADYVL